MAEIRTFSYKNGRDRDLQSLRSFLSDLRAGALISVDVVSRDPQNVVTQIVYETTYPKVLGVSPADGSSGITAAATMSAWVTFDEVLGDLGSTPASYVRVEEDGVLLIPTVSVALDPASNLTNRLKIESVFLAATKTYQVVIQPTLPFASGRTLGLAHIFTFNT